LKIDFGEINFIPRERVDIFKNIILRIYEDDEKREKIEALKGDKWRLKQDDFVFYSIFRSFCTWGRALEHNKIDEYFKDIKFAELIELQEQYRINIITKLLSEAGVRYAKKKPALLCYNINIITKYGGELNIKKILLSIKGKVSKIVFLKQFKGISNKYARLIMMDVCHDEFLNSVALDARHKNISRMLGLPENIIESKTDKDYEKHEDFYLRIAHSIGLNGWTIDKLIFNFDKEIISKLKDLGVDSRPPKLRRKTVSKGCLS